VGSKPELGTKRDRQDRRQTRFRDKESTKTTIEDLFEAVCSIGSMQRLYTERPKVTLRLLLCGGRVEYLHRRPASCRRQKGKAEIWDSKIWSRVPHDSDPKMAVLAKASSNCKQQTHPLVRESAPHQQVCSCLTVIKIWSYVPDGCFIPRQTGRLSMGHNITLTLTWHQGLNL
jgi:hypothetical protein